MLPKKPEYEIAPSIIPSPNGDYAIFLWHKNVDVTLVRALEAGGILGNYTVVGFTDTPYGALPWILTAIGTTDEFADPDADILWFDFIIDPKAADAELSRWLNALKNQKSLDLGIPVGGRVRLNCLIHEKTLKQFIEHLELAISVWTPRSDYAKATDWLWDNLLDQAIKDGQEFILKKYSQTDKAQILLDCFQQAVVGQVIDTKSDLYQLAQTADLDLIQNYLINWRNTTSLSCLNQRADSLEENLKRDWLFAKICLEQHPEQLKLAVGSIDNAWLWADLPYGKRPDILFLLSKMYRYLLGTNWKTILRRTDVLVPSIEIPTISELGKVPQRKLFNSVDKILQSAALDREFAILQPTAIIVKKRGLEEIEFFPIDKGGLKCHFKFTLSHDTSRDISLVVIGTLNAVAGTIEAIGVPPTPELRLILFLVAIAYRDLLVARDQAVASTTKAPGFKPKAKSKSKPKHQSLKLLARIKHNSSQIDKHFANPENIKNSLRKFSSYLRSCHIRKLHEGWQASEKALAIAEEYKWIIPEGYTFVQPAQVMGDGAKRMREEFRSISLMNVLFDKP